MTMLGFFLYAIIFVLPIFVTSMFHYDATQTGMLFIPGSLLTAMVMPFVGRQLSKRDPRVLIFIGLVAIEAFVFSLTRFTPQTSRGEILASLYIRGFAMAFMFVPINSSILSQFRGIELGQVSGLLNLSRQIGGSIGIALVATLMTMKSHQNYADLSMRVTMLNPVTQQFAQQVHGLSSTKMPKLVGAATPDETVKRIVYGKIQQQVFMLSFIQLVYMVGIIFLFAFIPTALLKLRTRPAGAVDAH